MRSIDFTAPFDDHQAMALHAIQIWPNDEASRLSYLQAFFKATLAEMEAEISRGTRPAPGLTELEIVNEWRTDLGGHAALADSPPNREVWSRSQARVPQAHVAGYLLLLIHSLYHSGPEHAAKVSLNKGIHLMSILAEDLIGRSLDRNQILAGWKEFRDVAHFWAAIVYMEYQFPAESEDERVSLDRTLVTVNHARNFLSFGIELTPKGSPKTLLDPSTTWRIGEFPWEAIDTPSLGLAEDVISSVDTYRAPKDLNLLPS